MVEVYATFFKKGVESGAPKYILCKLATDGGDCSSVVNFRGFVALNALIPTSFSIFGIVLLVHGLTPIPARELWAGHMKWCRTKLSCKCSRQEDSRGEI